MPKLYVKETPPGGIELNADEKKLIDLMIKEQALANCYLVLNSQVRNPEIKIQMIARKRYAVSVKALEESMKATSEQIDLLIEKMNKVSK